MSAHARFRYRDAEELLEKAEGLGINLPWQDGIAPLFLTFDILDKRVPNRLAVQPMEGCDSTPDGAPDELTFRRYRRFAQGGSGLMWFEASSVSAAGRSNPRQLHLTNKTLGAFERLVDMTRAVARDRFGSSCIPYLVLQLTHSGRFSNKESPAKPKVAYFNPIFDAAPDDVDVYRDEELDAIRDQFVATAILAQKAGFDAVDVKACHGYLLDELLSAFTRTDSSYGGDFECRARLLLEIVKQIQTSASRLALAVRINATDGVPYPYGFGVAKNGGVEPDLSEPLRLQQGLRDAGCVLLNVTAGIPAYAPHIGRPFNRPPAGTRPAEIHPLAGVHSLIRWAAAFQKAQPSLPVVGTGYSWLQRFWPHVGAAVIAQGDACFIGLGRSSFAYPDAPLDLVTRGKLDPAKCCTACSRCTELMRNHQVAGCVVRDPSIYKKVYANIRK
jgi:2,4-dienoyl-CoA reductase-like NADH-dependent reductase (Old Yellow Enzyme family)